MSSNYPPGVTGNEPHLTGEWPCENCEAILPEEASCPLCQKGVVTEGETDERWHCDACEWSGDSHVCPGDCGA